MSIPQGYPAPQPGQPTFGWAVPDPQQDPPPSYALEPSQPPQQQPPSGPCSDTYGGSDEDVESGFNTHGLVAFSEKSIRLGFVRKVYGILTMQLLLTVGLILLFRFENIQSFSELHPEIWISTAVVTVVLFIVLACWRDLRRRFPLNMILLILFTLCEGIFLGSITAHYKTDEILMAAGICTAVCLALTLFALQTKWDITTMWGIMFVVAVNLLIFGIWAIIIFDSERITRLVYASLGALIFSCYLVIDTQLMIRGKHKYSISPEEYIFAALNLYLDIIFIFLYILTRGRGSRK